MSDEARGFPAFPATTGRSGRFARSWWGRAWVQALEDTALDEAQLRQGRRYARAGYVGAITVSPGRLSATVQDYEDDTAHHTVVRMEPLSDDEWTRFLRQIGAEAGHIAALLDGDMPTSLVDAAADAGVRLLPEIGDLDPECPCPGFELPCRHAAALAYQTSWLLDADPFVLLLIRGRDQRALLHSLRTPAPPDPTEADPAEGTPAAAAFARAPVPLPEPPPLPDAVPGTLAIPPAPGIDPAALDLLATDAALRARHLLAEADGTDPSTLDLWPDTVRWAATHPAAADRLAATPGIARAAAAWQAAGAEGLDVLETAWTPDPAALAQARDTLASTWDEGEAPTIKVWRNRWTAGRAQLRYAPDGLWHPYRDRDGEWWPAGPPHRDAASALLSLL